MLNDFTPAICVGTAVRHRHNAPLVVLQEGMVKDLIRKLAIGSAVDAFSALACACQTEVTEPLSWHNMHT